MSGARGSAARDSEAGSGAHGWLWRVAVAALALAALIPDRPAAAQLPRLLQLGAVRIGPAYGRFSDADEGGLGGNAAFTAVFANGRLSVGPEVGWYGLGRNARQVPAFCPAGQAVTGPCIVTEKVSESAFELGAIAVAEPWPGRPVSPYALGAVVLDSWRSRTSGNPAGSLELLGYGLGAGLRIGPEPGPAALLEARWHGRASNAADTNLAGFFTLGVSLRYGW